MNREIDQAEAAFERGLSLDEYQTLILRRQAPWPLNDRPFNPPKRPRGTVVPLPKPVE
jgi:hypothetical protein